MCFGCLVFSCFLHFLMLSSFCLCNVHNASWKFTMMLHECNINECNLLVIGEYHIQKRNQALGSMEQCASINEPEELLFFGNFFLVPGFRSSLVTSLYIHILFKVHLAIWTTLNSHFELSCSSSSLWTFCVLFDIFFTPCVCVQRCACESMNVGGSFSNYHAYFFICHFFWVFDSWTFDVLLLVTSHPPSRTHVPSHVTFCWAIGLLFTPDPLKHVVS